MSSDIPERPKHDAPTDPAEPRAVRPEQVILIPRPIAEIGQREPARPERRRSRSRLALVLFLFTCLSTFLVGAFGQTPIMPQLLPRYVSALWQMDSVALREWFLRGLTYSSCVLAILGAHELGHYLQARRYRVPASLPYFIPFPISPFGTMGAVIVQQSGVADRKSMFDIAISGPLAGLVVALPLTYWGIRNSHFESLPNVGNVLVYGNPLLVKWMIEAVHGPIRAGTELARTPVFFAGWVGIFITALNLIPIGQLDGGHILYCLIRRRAHYVAKGLFLLAASVVAYSVFFGDGTYVGWSLMLFLIWMFGTRHPPTANDRIALGRGRVILGWITLLFIFIGLTPTPIDESKPVPQSRPPIRRSVDRDIHV